MKQIRPCSTWTRDSDDYLFNPQVEKISHFLLDIQIFSPNFKGRVSDTPPIELLKKKNLMEGKFSGIKFIR